MLYNLRLKSTIIYNLNITGFPVIPIIYIFLLLISLLNIFSKTYGSYLISRGN